MPLGRAKSGMRDQPPAELSRQRLAQGDGLALQHEVEIQAGSVQQEIAHETADDVNRHVPLAGPLSNGLQQFQQGVRQPPAWQHNSGSPAGRPACRWPAER